MVSPEIAKDPKWWYDERYAIYDLSVNSAAAYPQHNEELQLTSTISTYKARGYAYGGGGRRITRVEISLDKGRGKFLLAHNTYVIYTNQRYILQSGVWQTLSTQRINIEARNQTCSVVKSTCHTVRQASVGVSGLSTFRLST